MGPNQEVDLLVAVLVDSEGGDQVGQRDVETSAVWLPSSPLHHPHHDPHHELPAAL